MAFTQGIQTINLLAADQAVASSVVPVDITGFTKNIGASQRFQWELEGVFSLGATGGFRLQAHCTVAPSTYNATFQVVDETTPATFQDTQTAEAVFTNASAVAGNYILKGYGTIVAGAATVFSIQFAQNNSQVTPITMLKGLTLKLWQF